MEPLVAGDPTRVGDFVLHARLGAGGMGEVFLGRSPGGRAVAVKVVHPHLARQAEFRRRFRQEVAAARAVGGAFTAPVVAAGSEDDAPWIATVYVPGPPLAEAVAKAGPLPDSSVWPLAAGLAEALAAIHAERLLHRDLKPSNVLLAADGPRVIDFGIARAMDATALTGTGAVIGTPGFMSPEQAEGGQVGPPSDVFSLGAVLAFAATGSEPFGQGPPLAVLHRVVTSEPRLGALRGPVRPLITACLAKNPADRPTTAQLLERITSHWSPPDDFPDTPPWPHAMTTLIDAHAAPATLRSTPPPQRPTSFATSPPGREREGLTRPHQRVEQADRTSGPREADRLLAELIADYVRVLGPDHPETLSARHDQARDLGDSGRRAEAARLLAEVGADRARVLGPDHPDTLATRHSHAFHLGESGGYAEAARLLVDVAADRARVLGPEDPRTLTSRHNHAHYLGEAGERAEAARLLAEVAADRARVLGPDHPDALAARSNHAYHLRESGGRAEAARLLAEVAADRARVLGPDHPDTLADRHDQARDVGESGEHADAARLLAEVGADRARVLGPDHPDTLATRHSHAFHLGESGGYAEAARLLVDVAADRARVLGPDHPRTLTSRHNHAHYLGEAGNRAEAARLLAEVAADRARVLGSDHPDTLTARRNHAWNVRNAPRHPGAS
ncbi:tetratricopeptide repeat protein [Streptomyces sp. NPDC048565]|uniref:serine/threonine-protein kinase n=1 Tax=Streptomyces sp. NPDC048565 TaxID=3155266 RepID=UPI00341C6626